ncbi:MAG: glycoside hydrolase family 57 protein [Candidatus Diapherotrites archaeon]|nr:glycoside hydrolase family 57 protein [Candidatus Diapherotrites archaeon]
MPSICMYFEVHQPIRLRKFTVFSKAENPYYDYFDWDKNKKYFSRIVAKCYAPTNNLLLSLIDEYNIKLTYSMSGVFLEQSQKFHPEVIESFQQLVSTGNVELLDETYYHSLASLYSENEFKEQVKSHSGLMKDLFGYKPRIFRNTEALYSNDIAKTVENMGYKGILAEGAEKILGWRSPNYLYTPPNSNIRVLLRNYKLSDDIAFRFSTHSWKEHPLTADKYASWLSANEGQTVNLFMDYETFGEHQWESTGIFEFLKHLPSEIAKYDNLSFKTASETIDSYEPVGVVDSPYPLSWADVDRDLSAWLGNDMQRDCFDRIKRLEGLVKENGSKDLTHVWRLLQTSDHLYYLCTKWWADGDVHKYFNPYDSPYDAFVNYANILTDFETKLKGNL